MRGEEKRGEERERERERERDRERDMCVGGRNQHTGFYINLI